MNAAACSWRGKMSSIDDLRMDSTISRFSSPGIPKIPQTPSFSRAATSRSDALNMSCLPVECYDSVHRAACRAQMLLADRQSGCPLLGLVSFGHRDHAVE